MPSLYGSYAGGLGGGEHMRVVLAVKMVSPDKTNATIALLHVNSRAYLHTAGYDGTPGWISTCFRLGYPQEQPHVPTVLPTIRSYG